MHSIIAMGNIQAVDSMIDAGKMYLKNVPVLIDVMVVDNWYEKSSGVMVLLEIPSGTFQDRPGKEICGKVYMGEVKKTND
jgi:hypothetical protein